MERAHEGPPEYHLWTREDFEAELIALAQWREDLRALAAEMHWTDLPKRVARMFEAWDRELVLALRDADIEILCNYRDGPHEHGEAEALLPALRVGGGL